jgi:phospholipase/lecithinase/hemolysin
LQLIERGKEIMRSVNSRRDLSTRFVTRATVTALVLVLTSAVLPASAQKKADLTRLVVVGDSLSAGFQNGSLLDVQQPNGYAKLLAQQARKPLPLPLIAPPGIPNVLELISPGPPPVIDSAPGQSTGRDDPRVQAFDLAVPGANVQDALTTRPKLPITNLTDLILGLPGLFQNISRSQVEWAENLRPTTIVVWLGNNDALGAVLAGDPAFLTPVADFETAYATVMDRLAATGATLVVANIPDVTVVPFLVPAQEVAAELGLPLAEIGPILGIGPGDLVLIDAFQLIQAILQHAVSGPLPGNLVLTAAEAVQIRAVVDAYNAIIASQAAAKGAVLVDIHGFFATVRARGFVVGGKRLTTAFLGGVFSLDGIHPTNTGYAAVANQFIAALDAASAAGIPPLAVEPIAEADPLVLMGVGQPASRLGRISPGTMKALRDVIVH